MVQSRKQMHHEKSTTRKWLLEGNGKGKQFCDSFLTIFGLNHCKLICECPIQEYLMISLQARVKLANSWNIFIEQIIQGIFLMLTCAQKEFQEWGDERTLSQSNRPKSVFDLMTSGCVNLGEFRKSKITEPTRFKKKTCKLWKAALVFAFKWQTFWIWEFYGDILEEFFD